ncbi:MAG: hypothetical protein ACPGU0_02650 [Marinirhabdus sp.]
MKPKTLTLALLNTLTKLIPYGYSLINNTVSNLNDSICSNYTNMKTLEVKLIHAMTEEYKTKQLKAINDAEHTRFNSTPDPVNGDSRAIWFDLETLKEFIYHIEAKAKNHPTPAHSKDLGVRIYYASYPKYETWERLYKDLPGTGDNVLTQDYEERHTLVMVPTIRKDGLEVDFNPLDPCTYCKGMDLRTYSRKSTNPILAIAGIPKSGSEGAQNHGNLYPPLGITDLTF